jgi:ApeA N-terminal domain 1
VCLLDVLLVSQQFGTRPTSSKLHSNLLIHADSANDFSRAPILTITAEIDCLHEWVGVSGFSIDASPDFSEIQIKFRTPCEIEFELPGETIAFDFGRTGPSQRAIQKQAKVRQSTYVRIKFATPRTLEAAREKLLAVRDLIALAVGRSLSWKSVNAKFAVPVTEAGSSWASILDRPVGKPCNETLHPAEMLFTFPDVKYRFGRVLDLWFNAREAVKPLYTLYTATTRGQTLFSEHRLFNFFQALESYHRTRFEIDEQTKAQALTIKEKIVAGCSKEEQDWIRDKLQHLGEPSAAERIKALIERFNARWIFDPDWEASVKRIKNLRNYFTHFSKKPPSENLDSANIYNDGSRLQVLCEQILLVEVGFQPDEASALLQKNARLQRLTVR